MLSQLAKEGKTGSLLIKGGRILNPNEKFDAVADILIIDGVVSAIGENLKTPPEKDFPVYDAQGLVVTPGLVDMHVHLREPGLEAKEDIVSGTYAAAAGGFTTVACMANTKPVVDNAALVSGLKERARSEGVVNVEIIGALSKGQEGKELAEIGDMIERGAVAVSDDGSSALFNTQLIRTGLEYTGMFGKTVISHAEDTFLTQDTLMHEGDVSAMLGLRGRPSVAEDIAVARDVLLAEYTNSAVHIAHVSSKGAVDIIRQAKAKGVQVTAEATPHHLTLSDEKLAAFNTAFKINPPLRSQDHIQAVRAGLKDGTIDAIATDHSPHAFEEKDVEFKYAPSGFTGMETSLGVILTNLYHTGEFSLMEIIEKMSLNPAKILQLDAGCLQVGKKADLTVIDPDLSWTVESEKLYTRGKHTPFAGETLKGKAVATIINGKFIMKNGEVLA
ncbi:MAG: dihydroorotase [Sporomusaceae bacterium]|jgi:dihydroorotase|nr:dihydroorotase [Sporomusaceae bacterium]